jgi:hypothetical protein
VGHRPRHALMASLNRKHLCNRVEIVAADGDVATWRSAADNRLYRRESQFSVRRPWYVYNMDHNDSIPASTVLTIRERERASLVPNFKWSCVCTKKNRAKRNTIFNLVKIDFRTRLVAETKTHKFHETRVRLSSFANRSLFNEDFDLWSSTLWENCPRQAINSNLAASHPRIWRRCG